MTVTHLSPNSILVGDPPPQIPFWSLVLLIPIALSYVLEPVWCSG